MKLRFSEMQAAVIGYLLGVGGAMLCAIILRALVPHA